MMAPNKTSILHEFNFKYSILIFFEFLEISTAISKRAISDRIIISVSKVTLSISITKLLLIIDLVSLAVLVWQSYIPTGSLNPFSVKYMVSSKFFY